MGKEVFIVQCYSIESTLIDSIWSCEKKAKRYAEALSKIDDKNQYSVMPIKINSKFHQLKAYEEYVP